MTGGENAVRTGTMRFAGDRRTLYGISMVVFFAKDAFRVLIATVLPFLSNEMVIFIVILLMYIPLATGVVTGSRDNSFLFRFLACLGVVALIYLFSYLAHPEYSYWYFSGSYPVGERIFRPDQCIYAILFVSAVKEPAELIKYLKIAAYILLAYYSYRLIKARILGYWITVTTASGPQKAEYDLNYGYDHLMLLSLFLCCAVRERKKRYLLLAAVSFVEIILGGSRGPLIGVAFLLVIMYLKFRRRIPRWVRGVVLAVILAVLILWAVLGLNGLLAGIGSIIGKLFGSSSSRTIQALAGGSEVLDSSGRDRVYREAIGMIRNGFWGYGAYGDRYVLGQWLWVGYCHNIFLEMLIDFGWILGGIICIGLVFYSLKMLLGCKNEDWWFCFVIFFIPCTKLLLSGSFWFLESFWAAIAVYWGYSRQHRTERSFQWNKKVITNKLKAQ